MSRASSKYDLQSVGKSSSRGTSTGGGIAQPVSTGRGALNMLLNSDITRENRGEREREAVAQKNKTLQQEL